MTLTAETSLVDPLLAMTVVANILPILPVVLDTVADLPSRARRRKTLQALTFGNVAALAFAVGGGALLGVLHASLDDLRVAGGVILLVFAVYDLLFSREQRKEPLSELSDDDDGSHVGLVPLGVPMMVGPATLATVLVVHEAYGFLVVLTALVLNAALNAVLLLGADRLLRGVGHGGMRAVGKVFGLVLATLAVSMIRVGLTNLWRSA